VILLGRLIYRRPLAPHAVAGALISYAGVAMMFGGATMFGGAPTRLTDTALTGGGFVLAAAISFAFYQLFAREVIVQCGAALFTAVAMSSAGMTLLTQFALTHPLSALAVERSAWPLIVVLALFATVAPAFLMAAGTARVGAQGNAIIATLSPTVTIVLAVALLGEPFGWPEALGTLLVLAGVGLFTLVDARRARLARSMEPVLDEP